MSLLSQNSTPKHCLLWAGALLGGLLLAGCVTPTFNHAPLSDTQLQPVPPESVNIFLAGTPPSERYEVITALSVWGYVANEYELPLKAAAGRLGADAIIGVHNFSAPNVIGSRLQSGIAVRRSGAQNAKAQSVARRGVAIVILREGSGNDAASLAHIVPALELAAADVLQWRGWCPIHVAPPLPVRSIGPELPGFEILRDTEASLCPQMLVLRAVKHTGRVGVSAHFMGRDGQGPDWESPSQRVIGRQQGQWIVQDRVRVRAITDVGHIAYIDVSRILHSMPKYKPSKPS